MFLVNSRQRYFRCGPSRRARERRFTRIMYADLRRCFNPSAFIRVLIRDNPRSCAPHKRQAILRTYGRFFAEFLRGKSLVPLGLLALSTSVGLRYGFHASNFRSFSWKGAQLTSRGKNRDSPRRLDLRLRAGAGICHDTILTVRTPSH